MHIRSNYTPNRPTPCQRRTPRRNWREPARVALDIGDEVISGWHSHQLHQLEYALEGVACVETASARYLLPLQQAVWIPAGVEHCSTLTKMKKVSVFFDPSMDIPAGDRVRILPAAPLVREMILYASRWPIYRPTIDPTADTFFEALASVIVDWLELEVPLCVPTTQDPLVAAAIDYTNDAHLESVSLLEVCEAVGTSERTLRRAFITHLGMGWRQYLLDSRLLKAMSLIAQNSDTIINIGLAVGFETTSAFTRAFHRYAGETPTDYRQRTRAAPPQSTTTVPTATFLTAEQWSQTDRRALAPSVREAASHH
jgi:AraC-like DNA-binding protein